MVKSTENAENYTCLKKELSRARGEVANCQKLSKCLYISIAASTKSILNLEDGLFLGWRMYKTFFNDTWDNLKGTLHPCAKLSRYSHLNFEIKFIFVSFISTLTAK